MRENENLMNYINETIGDIEGFIVKREKEERFIITVFKDKRRCKECDGRGYTIQDSRGSNCAPKIWCEKCHGSGEK